MKKLNPPKQSSETVRLPSRGYLCEPWYVRCHCGGCNDEEPELNEQARCMDGGIALAGFYLLTILFEVF